MSTTTITVIERAKIEQINEAHRAVERAYGETLTHAIDCGLMLSAVKVDLGHGEWLPWLEDNFEGSARTAQTYMQLSANVEIQDAQTSADLSIAGALKQIQTPRKPSTGEVTNILRGIAAGDPDAPDGTVVERLEDARDRLRSEASATWSEQQTRKRHRAIDLLEGARGKLDAAASGGLSTFGTAETLREAAIEARHAAAALDDLAFTFER